MTVVTAPIIYFQDRFPDPMSPSRFVLVVYFRPMSPSALAGLRIREPGRDAEMAKVVVWTERSRPFAKEPVKPGKAPAKALMATPSGPKFPHSMVVAPFFQEEAQKDEDDRQKLLLAGVGRPSASSGKFGSDGVGAWAMGQGFLAVSVSPREPNRTHHMLLREQKC